MRVKIAISIFVDQLNPTNLKSSKTQFQFQFELSLAQISPSLFSYQIMYISATDDQIFMIKLKFID